MIKLRLTFQKSNHPMCNSNHHSSEKYMYMYIYIKHYLLYHAVLRQSIKKKKKNIRGIRIKSVVYLDFEMQQKNFRSLI